MITQIFKPRSAQKGKYIFLDRDGTINIEKNYLVNIEELEFERNAICGLQRLGLMGFNLVIVTNQSGIGRGLYTETEFISFQSELLKKCSDQGVHFAGYAACPHYNEVCSCRKPRDGMIRNFYKFYNVDISNSWFVGDKLSDIQAGLSAGLKTCLVRSGYGSSFVHDISAQTRVANDLLDFSSFSEVGNDRSTF